MLGKTAGGLFWMYRYLERAENITRMIETGQRIALTRNQENDDEWASVLQTASVDLGYFEKYDELSKDTVIDWMLRDKDNASSVMSAVEAARNNARQVRGALTHETWEAMNGCWMRLKELLKRKVNERDLPQALGLIRQRTALVRGATHGTLLRNDIYDFARIGTFLERADNTGRILDVKYYVLLPSANAVGSQLDNVQWETILRSVSGESGIRMVYGHNPTPRDIAAFLILDGRMPRSLYFCAKKLQDNLGYLAHDYGETATSHDLAVQLGKRLKERSIDEIFDIGLHEFIQEILIALGELSRQIEVDYRFYE
ncbi:alpha-E domain-containing protein [Vannielia litorea]|uniref:alpha-E domain-containing protein n=1 Tax=Vannielia TaxID=2813041 RepID=UPI001C94E02B|nr:alpha-E domain-containing protein [Vannielia litorea]MBY6049365.1 alpha-E domain-containing protein [Vannielia litorea]MBY6076779.1 alpha-E domain-containing protein [Vannielia litorea]MBY6155015.1 alpha-E domain-containing protein [Vannielia litorea]